MNKSERIRDLYQQGLSVADIAKKIGCSTAYVRVAARQRVSADGKQGQRSKADKRYWTQNVDLRRRLDREYHRLTELHGNKKLANRVAASVREKLRQQGVDVYSRAKAAASARKKILLETSRHIRQELNASL